MSKRLNTIGPRLGKHIRSAPMSRRVLLVLLFATSLALLGCGAAGSGNHTQIGHSSVSKYSKGIWTADHGIVYVRVPRSDRILHVTKEEANKYSRLHEGDPLDPSFMDNLPEVSHILGGFNAPGQLVWRHEDGSETVIFDCVNGMPDEGVKSPNKKDDDICVPLDPVVSFDGTKVAFSVYHGKAERRREIRRVSSAQSGETWRLTSPTWAGIYIYNFKTRQLTHWRHQKGVWDTAPVWLPNGRMMFTSTRGGVYTRHTFPLPHSERNRPILQLWIANQDGTDARSIGTQQQDLVLHPIIHSSGRVIFSTRELPFARYWDRFGFADGRGDATKNNVWWLESVDLRGGNLIAHTGAHNFERVRFYSAEHGTYPMSLQAMHFLAELSNGDICTDVYYRADNMGGGRIVCWPTEDTGRSPLGHEGPYPFDFTSGGYIAVNGQNGDSFGAKIRDPAALPDGKILFSGAFGKCHWPTNKGHISDVVNYTRHSIQGDKNTTCDMGIYAKQPLGYGFDPYRNSSRYDRATKIVNKPQWHEFMPEAVLPYKAIYGLIRPKQLPLTNSDNNDKSYGVFASVNVLKGNVKAADGWNGPEDGRWCHFQGCALQSPFFVIHEKGRDYDLLNPKKVRYMRFWKVVPLKHAVAGYSNRDHRIANLWGQKTILMGDVPVQSDGSFKAKLPADIPFLMSGVDAQGRAIARHQHVMALRPGEKQVCAGCHLHATTDEENAAHPFSATIAAGKPAVSPKVRWANEKRQPEWTRDIYPMLKENCASCHDGGHASPSPDFAESSGQLYVDLTHYDAHVKYPKGLFPTGHPETEDGSIAATPWLTRYINGLFSRESLLYWKAAGARLDGRYDRTRNDDFDFGPAHESYLTSVELRTLSDWIEGGLYCDTSQHQCGLRGH